MEVDRWKGEVLGLPQKFDLGHFCTENVGGRRERRKDGERERRENACERQTVCVYGDGGGGSRGQFIYTKHL